jgi:hypothetical protein
VKEM